MTQMQRGMAWAAALLVFLAVAAHAADFGEVVRFRKGKAIDFPKLTLTYLGTRHVDHPVFKPGFTYYDFEARSGNETKTVSWSSGTGLIDATAFEIGGETYELELRGSVAKEGKGWIRDDELVLWKQKDYLKALERKRR